MILNTYGSANVKKKNNPHKCRGDCLKILGRLMSKREESVKSNDQLQSIRTASCMH